MHKKPDKEVDFKQKQDNAIRRKKKKKEKKKILNEV